MRNLFDLPVSRQTAGMNQEYCEILADGACRIERIISSGQSSPEGFWYDQEQDEWVTLVQGKACLKWEDGSLTELNAGDWLVIPAGKKHRVEWTSQEMNCVWLAVHGRFQI